MQRQSHKPPARRPARRAIAGLVTSILSVSPGVAQTANSFFVELPGMGAMENGLGSVGDYDNDGWPDLFLGEQFGSGAMLYHNDGHAGLSERPADLPGPVAPGMLKGAGSVFGDYDNDGDLDLFVPVKGTFARPGAPDLLLRNERGSFRDVATAAGVAADDWTDDALWLDHDRDGLIDLYTRNAFFRNVGDGTFLDVTAAVGLESVRPQAPRIIDGGMVAADFDDDSRVDLYLGSWDPPNRLLLADDVAGFRDVTTSEIAEAGRASGIAVGDVNNDGSVDIFQSVPRTYQGTADRLSELDQVIYRPVLLINVGAAVFVSATEGAGMSALTGRDVWSPALVDIDNDGDLDLLGGGGRTEGTSERYDFVLFRNDGIGAFTEISDQVGVAGVGLRGVTADFNRDGAIDAVWTEEAEESADLPGAPLHQYRNTATANHWIEVDLVGVRSNRDGFGARVIVNTPGRRQTRQIRAATDPGAHFGLGEHRDVDRLEVRWPSGTVDVFSDVAADRRLRIVEGAATMQVVMPTIWEREPDTLRVGDVVDLQALLRPGKFDPEARFISAVADLRGLGGPGAVSLAQVEDGLFELQARFEAEPNPGPGPAEISVMVEQQTAVGPYFSRIMHGRIVQRGLAAAIATSVHSDPPGPTPADIGLGQNRPNPFNGSTVIPFVLDAPAFVELSVYDLLGRRIARLVHSHLPAGPHAVTWTTGSAAGDRAASGGYFCRLRTGDLVQTRRMLLIR